MPDLKTQPYSFNLILNEAIAESFKKCAKVDAINIETLPNRQMQKVEYIESTQALKAIIEQ